ncbi:MAG: hypothetical protein ACLPGW_11185 [Roseiarcus sp.]
MRKMAIAFAATAAILSLGAMTLQADAQTTRGAGTISNAMQNFTPIEKAACGPHWGRWCGPWHHRVCGPYRCWCAPC